MLAASTLLTYNTHDEFVVRTVYPDDQRIVHDIDIRKELAVVVQGAAKDALGMFAEVERGQMSS